PTMMDRSRACDSKVPDALIHIVPSRLSDVFPPGPCTSAGSVPMRADRSIKAANSVSVAAILLVISSHSPHPVEECIAAARHGASRNLRFARVTDLRVSMIAAQLPAPPPPP